MADIFNGNVNVNGTLFAQTLQVANADVTDARVVANTNVNASKLMHENWVHYSNSDSSTSSIAEQRVVYRCNFATLSVPTIVAFNVGSVVICGTSTTFTVQLLKNGVDISSGGVILTHSSTAYVTAAATLSPNTMAAGDVLEVKCTRTSGTNYPQGVFAQVIIQEPAN